MQNMNTYPRALGRGLFFNCLQKLVVTLVVSASFLPNRHTAVASQVPPRWSR